MTCPKCRLESFETAQRCDCGYDFEAKEMRTSYLELERQRRGPQPSEEVRAKGRHDMLVGFVCFSLGVVVTLATYRHADQTEGQYVIVYGAIVWGAIWFIRGWDRSRSGIDREFWGKRP